MIERVLEYRLPADGHSCEGWSYGQDFEGYVRTRVKDRCADGEGSKKLAERARDAKVAGFDQSLLSDMLEAKPPDKPWKVGECLAECFLEDHEQASLPNPRRALKNPRASPAGADLVGFSKKWNVAVFLFGEVKTSGSAKSPPSVVSGMASQLKDVMSDESDRQDLIRWLALSVDDSELQDLSDAVKNYSEGKYAVAGVLIRDTEPLKSDLASVCSELCKRVAAGALFALYALYMPVSIERAGRMAGRFDG